MSKLATIREALETNPEVIIAGVQEELSSTEDFWHSVNFYVAPQKGLYTAKELEEFMMRLIPDLKPTGGVDFHQYNKDNFLLLGKLYFDEKVAEERTITQKIITLTDAELLANELIIAAGFVDGKQTIDQEVIEEYTRRTTVRPFPNEAVARMVINADSAYFLRDIHPSDLAEYQTQESLSK